MTKALSRCVTEDTAWMVCCRCRGMIYSKRLVRNLRVCPDCGSHQQLTAHERIEQLFDEAHVELLDVPVCGGHGIGSSIHTDGL